VLTERLWVLAVLVPSVILHEVSHGAVALAFGDDTAKRAGRLTLNPLPHIDPFGTIILPLLLSLTGLGAFGWAKPVPVNPSRLRSPRNQYVLVSLAGPAVNVVLALVAAVWLRLVSPDVADVVLFGGGHGLRLDEAVFLVGFVNVILAAFNLLPVPPLDGSSVVQRLLPARWWQGWARVERYSMGLLLLLVLLAPGLLNRVFDAAVDLWANLL
jgi:Zn-dependent protease